MSYLVVAESEYSAVVLFEGTEIECESYIIENNRDDAYVQVVDAKYHD